MNAKYKAISAFAVLIVVYTLYTILLQIGGSTIGLIPQLFYAFIIGFVASLAVSLAIDRGKGLISILGNPKMLVAILAIGLINNALAQLFLGIGTLGTNAIVSGVVYRIWIVAVALLTPLVLRQRVKRMQLLATLVGFAGLYLVVSGGTLFSINMAETPYIGFILLSALFSVIVTLIYGKYTFNILAAIVFYNLISVVAFGLLAVFTHTSLAVAFPTSAIFSVLVYGILGFGISSPLYYYSVKVLGPQMVGNTILVVPFLVIILSAIILGTPVEAYYVIAAVLITGGVLLQRHYSKSTERITRNKRLDRFTVFDVTGTFIDNKSPEISNGIAGDNRAFAIRINANGTGDEVHSRVFGKYNCIAFTSRKPHTATTADEIATIKEAMGLEEGETALIGLGNPDRLEEAFDEFVTVSGNAPPSTESDWKRQ